MLIHKYDFNQRFKTTRLKILRRKERRDANSYYNVIQQMKKYSSKVLVFIYK